MKKRILILLIIFSLISFVSLSQTACDKDPNQIRTHVKDAIAATHGIVAAIQTQIPKTDPRYQRLKLFQEALDRFDQSLPIESKDKLVVLFADLVTAFREAVLPLLQFGGTVAIAIVAVDTAFRFIANRLMKAVTKNKDKLTVAPETLQEAIAKCTPVLVDFLASPPACATE